MSATARRSAGERLGWAGAVITLIALTAWALGAGSPGEAVSKHLSPATVHAVEGSEFAEVSLTEAASRRLGLEIQEVTQAPSGEISIPYAALVYGADGTTWAYVEIDTLTFARATVTVNTITGERASLSDGLSPGTRVVGLGSAELFGAEFEVGH